MKGYHVTRSLSQHATGPCVCGPEDLDIARNYMPHPQDYYAYYTPGVSHDPSSRRIPSYGGGTFPRSHPGQQQPYDPGPAHHHGHTPRKAQRAVAGHLEQYDRQLEGFHTLQYQRAATGGEQRERPESPSRIRHLVHSVQRLFTKSQSLEAPSKRELSNGGGRERGGAGGNGQRHPAQRAPRSARRSKSHDRTKTRDFRHRGRNSGWWSSDDNLDSDSGYLPVSRGQRGVAHGHHTLEGAVQDLTLRTLRVPRPPGDCATCSTVALMGDPGLSMKKSAWAAMTVSQARDVAHSPSVAYDTGRDRSVHLLQVPSEEWGGACVGGASDSVGEIPCRRMRSGSYIRAMGDDESVDSDTSPTPTPKKAMLQREAFRRSISMDQQPKYSCKQCANTYANSRTMPRNHSCMHMQRGESMCESVFGDFVESQAVEALDLPGSFRARSHSYVRAIQAGVSQDDDCLPVFSLSGPQGGAKGAAVFPHKRKLPPPLPPRMSRPQLSVSAQSSTESTQEAYFQSTGQPAPRRPRQHSNSMDGDGRSSRGGYHQGAAGSTGQGSHQHSNSAESLGGPRGGQMGPKHSSSADNLLEGGGGGRGWGGAGGRGGAATLGKSISLPHNGKGSTRTQEDCVQDGHGRKWRPSTAVQVDNSEAHSDLDRESKMLRQMQCIGVQVEDKRRGRFRRSCSVMSSLPTDLEREELQGKGVSSQFSASFQRHASELEETRTVHTQGQWAYHDNYHHANEARHAPGHAYAPPSGHAHPRAPPQGHALEHERGGEGSHSLPGSARASPYPRDSEFYLRLLHTEVERMEGWCQRFEREAEANDLPEEALAGIRSAVGSAQQLMSQKVQQFFRLCQQSLDPTSHPQPSPQDLAELWDLLQLAIEEVRLNFQELQRLKDSGWQLPVHLKEDKSLPPPLPKKPSGGVGGGRARGGMDPRGGVSREPPPLPAREKSVDLIEQQGTLDPHGRLLQAKRSAHSFRQNSATESADSIEIYIPEAQTRF